MSETLPKPESTRSNEGTLRNQPWYFRTTNDPGSLYLERSALPCRL